MVAVPQRLATALADLGLGGDGPGEGRVFAALEDVGDDWEAVRAELTGAFEVTRAAMQEGRPLVFVVAHDDLLGRRGSGRAMVAAGLLSAARTAAVEARRAGVPVNTLAVEAEWDPETVARWVLRLMEPGGPTGELIRLGGDHLGKALP